MNNLLSFKFWFSIYPGPLSPTGLKFFAISILFFILTSIIIKILISRSKEKLNRRMFRKLLSFAISNTFILLFIFFLMYETVPFLSSRFWLLVLGIINIVWLTFIFKFYSKIPSQKEEREKEQEYNKYIP